MRAIYFVRAAAAVVWAILFALIGGLPLLVLYPVIDAVASVADARLNRAALPYVNAFVSLATAGAIAVAGLPDGIVVFGGWAAATGLIQLIMGLRRRTQLGGQWVNVVSGAFSTVAGVSFAVAARSGEFATSRLSVYATFGALLFVVSAIRMRSTVAIGPDRPQRSAAPR